MLGLQGVAHWLRRSGDINNGKRECEDDSGNRFLEAHRRSFPGKNSFHSLFRLTCFGHRNALPPYPSRGSMQRFEEAEQNSGVVFSIRAASQGGFVARLFGEVSKLAIQPPGEWAEPENRSMQQRKTLRERIAARNVRHLVGDDGVELAIVPF